MDNELKPIGFQSTLPQGERHQLPPGSHPGIKHFNPRSHKGSDPTAEAAPAKHTISIHAPTRGATGAAPRNPLLSEQFQSTLPQGERLLWIALNVNKKIHFNPRSHKGSDNIDTRKLTPSQIFQSTLPQGERRSHFPAMSQYRLEFQSTLPQGERPYNKVMSGATSYFNPRSHKGSDVVLGSQEPQKQAISIHAPTRGATFCTGHYNILHCNFNPRSHKGSDVPLISPYFQTSNISIHAPTRGATCGEAPRSARCGISIHAPTRGATSVCWSIK